MSHQPKIRAVVSGLFPGVSWGVSSGRLRLPQAERWLPLLASARDSRFNTFSSQGPGGRCERDPRGECPKAAAQARKQSVT